MNLGTTEQEWNVERSPAESECSMLIAAAFNLIPVQRAPLVSAFMGTGPGNCNYSPITSGIFPARMAKQNNRLR
jgi:hypothetical protein